MCARARARVPSLRLCVCVRTRAGDWDTIAAAYAPRPFAILQNRDDFWWPKPGFQQVVDSATAVYKLYGKEAHFVHQFFNAIHTVDSPFREAIVQRFLDTL